MLLSVVIPVYNRADVFAGCIERLYRHTKDFEIIVIDNGSGEEVYRCLLPYFKKGNLKYVRLSYNAGFSTACNIGAAIAEGDYICLLNSDMYVAPRWAEAMIKEFKPGLRIAQVGCNPVANYLDKEGNGHPKGGVADYIEASLVMLPREIYKTHGLFNEDYRYGYCEDADLSLRLRSLGYEIRSIGVSGVKHLHAQTSTLPELRGKIDKARRSNMEKLRKEWGHYLKNRNFNRTILIRRGAAIGDVFLLSPVLRKLRETEPAITIDVETACPQTLLGNPNVRNIIPHGQGNRRNYDAFYDLDLAYERNPRTHIVDVYSDELDLPRLSGEDRRPILYLNKTDEYILSAESVWIGIDLGPTWPNRIWILDNWKKLIEILREHGYKIVSLGATAIGNCNVDLNLIGKTSIRQTASIISQCRVFVGHDGLLGHIAQAMKIRHVLMWGCTKPCYRVTSFNDGLGIYILGHVTCQGCHHDLPAPRCHTNCEFGTNECMKSITVEEVYEAIVDHLIVDEEVHQ